MEKEGIPFKSVPSGPVVGMLSATTAKSAVKLGLGVIRAHGILRKFRPDVLVGTGGYTSAGVAVAEWFRRGKVVIHEQNSIPGRTNLLLAKLAKRVCVTFDDSVAFFPRKKTVVTGLPVRPEIAAGMDARAAREALGLDTDRFTVLVLGGSQGAKRVNQVVLEALSEIAARGMQVLHLTGEKNYKDVMSKRPDVEGYHIRDYVHEMAAAYSAADVVISRSGASTLAEITVRGLPSILIPYPFAQADHQTKNAEAVARAGAAVVIDEGVLTAKSLKDALFLLADNPSRLQSMVGASRKLGRPNAAREIVRVIQEVAQGG